jgi:redox-sensitive bicupin YhaK (pirin superfamily)
MLQVSSPYMPSVVKRGDVFVARQYPRQAFGDLIDPVLNIDWFEMKGPTFPAHPHAGFSAVTYLFADSPNGFHNRDSLGEVHNIRPGGLHWTRASSGIIHEETPLPNGGAVSGLQIFVNLPASDQADGPAAFPVVPEAVITETGVGWQSRTAIDGTKIGSADEALPSPVRITEVAIDAGSSFTLHLPECWGGVIIALKGSVVTDDQQQVSETEAVGFAAPNGGNIHLAASEGPARLAIVMGAQLRQPIHASGPLMMASAAALAQAKNHVATLSIPN